MTTPSFTGTVEKGILHLTNRSRFDMHLQQLSGQVSVTIKRHRAVKSRSVLQNRYYWGVVVGILSAELGYSDDEMHDALRFQFLQKRDGKLPTIRSTTTLSTVEMEQYLATIRNWASHDLGIYILLPRETEFNY